MNPLTPKEKTIYIKYIFLGSRFSDRVHYKEFVKSRVKSWALTRRRLVFRDERHKESGGPTSQGEGTPRSRTGMRQSPLDHVGASLLFFGPPLFGWSLLLFIPLFRSSSPYTCQSSMSILKCTSPQPFFLALCELLWPPLLCPGVKSTSKGVRVLIVCI